MKLCDEENMRGAVTDNSRRRRGLRVFAGCVGAMILHLGLAGCALFDNGDQPQLEDAIKVLSANPITGSLSFMGPGLEKSMTLAVREINAAGGILGRPLQLVTADTHSDEVAGLSESVYYYVENPDVVGIAGASPDAVSKRLLVDVAKNSNAYGARIPMVSPASTSAEFVGLLDQFDLFFRTVCNSELEGRILAEKAREKGYKLGVAIGISDINNTRIFDTFRNTFFGFGSDYDITAHYYSDSTVAEINKTFVKAYADARLRYGMEPQFILLLAYGSDGKVALNEWARHYTATPLLLSDALMSDYFMASLDPTTLKALEEGVVNGVFPGGGLVGEAGAVFTDAFCGKYPEDCRCEEGSTCEDGVGLQPSIFAANAYDAIYTLALGLTIAAKGNPQWIVRGSLWNIRRITDGILAGVNQDSPDQPDDVVFGPGEWARAREGIEADQSVDYTGASSSSLELDSNGDPRNCDFSFWSVVGGRPVLRNSDGEKQSVSVNL